MIIETARSCFYEDPSPPIYIKAGYLVTLLGLGYLVISELIGKHLQYSKFWNLGGSIDSGKKKLVSSKIGMLIFYTPALVVCVSSFFVFPNDEIRFLMLKSVLAIHFLKRDLEVLFLHKYSGSIVLDSAVFISAAYSSSACGMLYFQHRTKDLSEPSIDLKSAGLLLFIIGISGNFYHHYLLSKLRNKSDDDKGYKIPRGGLFDLVVCPHYLFEILTFIGVSLISCAAGVAFYLLGRGKSTRNWYLSKFESFPKSVKAVVPYVF